MDTTQLHLSDPMTDIASENSARLADMYDDFSKHSTSPVERPSRAV